MSKIAVLMSTFNGEKYLSQQIDSILNQTLAREINLFIRDDGSTDGTKLILEEYRQRYPNKICVFYSNNIGLNASFFWLIKSIEGFDYYCISDQDDVWEKDKVEVAIKMLRNEDDSVPLLYASSSYLVHDDLVPFGETRKKEKAITVYNSLIQNISPGHTQVFNRALKALLSFDFDLSKIYVYDSWILNEAVLYGRLIFDNKSHTFYRQHENNQLGSGKNAFQKLMKSGKRIRDGHGKLYKKQIEYFNSVNSSKMIEIGAYDYVNGFVNNNSFFSRFFFSCKPRFYRQKRVETMAFYFAYIFGKI